MGAGTKSARGGRMRSATSRSRVIETVVIPARSSADWTRQTVWLHIGQSGVKRTTSTPSSRNIEATAGAVSSINGLGPMIDPMKLK